MRVKPANELHKSPHNAVDPKNIMLVACTPKRLALQLRSFDFSPAACQLRQ